MESNNTSIPISNNNYTILSNKTSAPSASTTAAAATTTTTNNTSEDTEMLHEKEMRHRFKVVKLVSSQPYTRGRWTCFDYNDENQNTINIAKHVPANKILPNGHTDNATLCNDHNSNTTANNAGSDQSEVAIDNKIEQAMDLVKSHLMFAVREEVDVLKERIKELEADIQILVAHATPETLALLSNRSSSTNVE